MTAVAGAALAGLLGLTACGTDQNTPSSGNNAQAAGPGSEHCAKGSIEASGSSAQAVAMDAWKKAYQEACEGATINYQSNGSGAGVSQFIDGSTAFAGSDSALKDNEVEKAKQRCGGNPAVNLPMVTGPVAVVYNLDGVDGLQLSPETIAGIFAGKITKWDDAAIKKDNPDADLPGKPIKSVHRSDESGTTDNFTDYLKSTASSTWTWEPEKKWQAPGGQGAKGSEGVTAEVKRLAGSISYVEFGHAKNADLSMAKVKNGAGEYTELTPESAAATVSGAKIVGQGNDLEMEIDYATDKAGAYPIVLVTYEITCEKGLEKDQLAMVKAFLGYTVSDEGQQELSEIGYAPLAKEVQAKVEAAVKALA